MKKNLFWGVVVVVAVVVVVIGLLLELLLLFGLELLLGLGFDLLLSDFQSPKTFSFRIIATVYTLQATGRRNCRADRLRRRSSRVYTAYGVLILPCAFSLPRPETNFQQRA